jgi:SAM-dependent methyltransferase
MLLRALLELRPSRLRARAARRATDAAFDRANGVDTGGKIRPGAMRDVRSENRPHGVQYEATDAGLFGEMIDASGIDPSCYELVDFGSGKGRVLLLASRLPFREVIGVEYSPALHRIAELNLRGALRAGRRSGPVWSVCADAARFPLPDGPLVLYFFNPFGRPVMKRVRDNVVASYGASPRGIVVVYHNPEHADLWEAVGFLERLAWSTEKGRDYAIYAGGPRTQGATTEPNSPTFG